MSEQHTDPEGADPMSGAGIVEDDYSEASWADDSPLDDPEADQYAEDVRRDGTGEKRKGEESYDQRVDGRAGGTGETELDELARRIRRLEDEQSIRVGVNLDSGAGEDPWGEDDGSGGIQVLKSKPSKLLTAEEWVALDVWDDRLGEPFPWETKARIDQTEALPLGMGMRWESTRYWVELLWRTLRSAKYDEHELAVAESDAIYEITLRVVDNRIPMTEAEHAVTLEQKRVFGEETRGGARKRKARRQAKRVYLDGSIAGTDNPYFRYDFRTAAKGVGKGARADTKAIEHFALATQIEEKGKRWIDPTQPPALTFDDFKLQQGRRVDPELARRVRELVEMGAFYIDIAKVLGWPVTTVKPIGERK
jgi:hypothetical protein